MFNQNKLKDTSFMRQSFLSVLIACASILVVSTSSVQAQDAYVANDANTPQLPATRPATEAPATMVLTGRVKTVGGALPGAVIKIANSKQMVVTDSDGSFHVTVPANSGPVQATASYAGFADEAITLNAESDEVTMKTARIIVVSKSQSLKTYQKTARKQVKRSVHKVRKANK